jgi:hypothetical protein
MGCKIEIKVTALLTHRYECPGVKIPKKPNTEVSRILDQAQSLPQAAGLALCSSALSAK